MMMLSKMLRGRSKTTLTRFCPLLTTYLPTVDICEGITLMVQWKICIQLTFPVPPTYLVLSTQFANDPLTADAHDSRNTVQYTNSNYAVTYQVNEKLCWFQTSKFTLRKSRKPCWDFFFKSQIAETLLWPFLFHLSFDKPNQVYLKTTQPKLQSSSTSLLLSSTC